MSQARYYEPNVGSLRLDHDQPMTSMRYNAAPSSDFSTSHILAHRTPVQYQTDHRFKGYPGQSFLSPRIPVSQLLQETRNQTNYHHHDGYYGIDSLDTAKPTWDFPTSRILAHRAPIYYQKDHRFKGYPGQSFLSPRIPVSQLLVETKNQTNYHHHDGYSGLDSLDTASHSKDFQTSTVLAHRTSPLIPIRYQKDFRFKGYPAQDFSSPRIPISHLPHETRYEINYYDDLHGVVSVNEVTPRGFQADPLLARPAPILIRTDARFKGYPGNSFHSPRIPVSQSPEAVEAKKYSPRDFYGKFTLFEPGRPKLDEGHRGLQYGSQNHHIPPPAPKPTQLPPSIRAVPFGEDKTTAEIEKRRELQREADQDLQRHRAEQARRKEREMAEKKKDFDQLKYSFMLDRHSQGHGAARGDGDHKRRKFTEESEPKGTPRYRDPTYGDPKRILTKPLDIDLRQDKAQHPDYFLDEFNKRKTDAPSDFNPGNHSLRGEGIIRFQEEGRKSIENRFRYNKPQQEKEELRRDLERQKEDKELRDQKDKIRELRQELEMMKAESHSPSGGGAPNRSKSGNHVLLRKIIFHSHDPIEQRKILLREEHAWTAKGPQKKVELKSLELDRTQGGAGAPVVNSDGSTVTRLPITMKRDDMGVASIKENVPGRGRLWEPEADEYMVFGKPGAGAPVRDSEGRIITAVYGKLGGELSSADRRRRTRAARLLKDDLQKEMEEQKKNKEDMDNYMKAPVGELSEIMMKGKVGRPQRDPVTGNLRNQHLGNSDVSRQKMNKPEVTSRNDMKDYYNYLTRQAQERETAKKLDRLRDNQEWRQHNDASGMMFGSNRLGGGYRKGENLRKEKLSNTLFSPRRDENGKVIMEKADSDLSQAPEWMKPSPRDPPPDDSVRHQDKSYQSEKHEDYSSSNMGQRYTKSTFQSSNRNMYELPQSGPANPYSTQAPYAIHNY